jgi:hypothetical protein
VRLVGVSGVSGELRQWTAGTCFDKREESLEALDSDEGRRPVADRALESSSQLAFADPDVASDITKRCPAHEQQCGVAHQEVRLIRRLGELGNAMDQCLQTAIAGRLIRDSRFKTPAE